MISVILTVPYIPLEFLKTREEVYPEIQDPYHLYAEESPQANI